MLVQVGTDLSKLFTYIYFYYIFKDEKCFDSMICLHK